MMNSNDINRHTSIARPQSPPSVESARRRALAMGDMCRIRDVRKFWRRGWRICGLLAVLLGCQCGRHTPPPVRIDPITGLEFVQIPGGCFEMGQSEVEKQQLIAETNAATYTQYFTDELPRHPVCVSEFWIAKTEVTNGQYRQWRPDHDSLDFETLTLNDDAQPVVNVSWEDAKGFIQWLNGQQRQDTFRLPTEAEWEYACRAKTTTARFWGDDPAQACQYANIGDLTGKKAFAQKWPDWTIHACDDGYAVTAPVGTFRPNAFGVYDILGNVWEWCEDVYVADIYSQHAQRGTIENPLVTNGGLDRVARGGCWSKQPRHVRCASRHFIPRTTKSDSVGFRLAMSEK